MKTLFILRHAKSSWEDPSLSDFDRPLNERGQRTAPFMGELMRQKGFEPALVLSSPAIRAKQTAELVCEAAGLKGDLEFDGRIYEASTHRLAEVVASVGGKHASAMIVGHNPGIEGFIHYLTRRLEPMPTAALAVIDLNIDNWDEIDEGCGELLRVFRPKEEMK